MCDMDCGSDGGFDVGADSDVSEGTDFESGSYVDAGSSFEGMDDVTEAEDFEGDVESFDADMEADSFDTDMEYGDEYYSLDEFDDVEDVDELSQDIYEVEETTESEAKLDDEISEMDTEMLEENETKSEEELMVELSQLDAVESEMMDAAYLEELERANADNPEFLDGINRLIDEGKISVVDSSEITDEISGEEDDVKVLTREVTEEVFESRERDTEEVLNNYRESLETRGVAEEQIEEFLGQERDKINAEYESLDRGDTSSNIYEIPSDLDEIAETLLGHETTDVETDLRDSINVADEMVEMSEESELEQAESAELIDERVSEETGIDGDSSEEFDNISVLESGQHELEETVEDDDVSIDEELHENGTDEVQEIAINYDEIYEEIQQEALEQGFENIDILADAERLDSSLESFEESIWENLSLEEQKESLSNLAEYVEETIGFENPAIGRANGRSVLGSRAIICRNLCHKFQRLL